jgi:FixJ family two-component response regulator
VSSAERRRVLAAAARESRRHYLDDIEARDAEIMAADADGVGVREIARDMDLAPGHVQKIIVARAAERQGR